VQSKRFIQGTDRSEVSCGGLNLPNPARDVFSFNDGFAGALDRSRQYHLAWRKMPTNKIRAIWTVVPATGNCMDGS
jgi:hypothetical protein